MPTYDARSAHELEVRADPATVYRALLTADFRRNPVVATLMAMRAIPAVLLAPRRALARWRARNSQPPPGPMGTLLAGHFALLAEQPPTEVTFGLTGRFWMPLGELVATDPARFRDQLPPGLARAAWNFHLVPLAPGRTRLSTETRVACADPPTRRAFLRYWRIIRVGSALIRLALLRQVKYAAEHAGV